MAQHNSEREWTLTHNPAVTVLATVTKAAIPQGRHYITGIFASISGAAAASGVELLTLTDGSTVRFGAGLNAAINDTVVVQMTGLNWEMDRNSAAVLAFAAGGAAGSIEAVTLMGYTMNTG